MMTRARMAESNGSVPADRQMGVAPDLKSLQELLYRLITAAEGVEEGLAAERMLPEGGLDAIIVGDERLSARERVEIYANAYFYRVLDVLKEDFPATLGVVGETNFHNLITSYLIEYPPTEPGIQHAGRHLPGFVRTHPLRERWPFIADLARLERCTIEVFHGPDVEPLGAAAMRAVAPDDWPGIRLRTHPNLRILELDWRVDMVLRAVADGEPWKEPARERVAIMVWRRDLKVQYRELERGECAALTLAQNGAAFAAMCDAIVAEVGEDEDAPAQISRLVGRWLGEDVLVREKPWPARADAAS